MLVILGKLFGSPDRVKVIRLFMLNQNAAFSVADVVARSKVTATAARRELKAIAEAGLVKKARNGAWEYNSLFPLAESLKNLVVSAESIRSDDVLHRFKNAGRIKLLVVAGVFIQSDASRADILLVGDNLKRPVIERQIRALEAEIGKELRYSVLETEEFKYRLSVYDKFIHDVLDFPHVRLIDRLTSA